MATDDDSPVSTSWDLDDHRFLGKGCVREHLHSHAILPRIFDDICNLGEEPLGRFCTGLGLTEARVVSRVVLQVLLDIVPVELRDETLDLLAVLELRWVRSLLFDRANFGVEFSDVEKVATTAAVLASSQYRITSSIT